MTDAERIAKLEAKLAEMERERDGWCAQALATGAERNKEDETWRRNHRRQLQRADAAEADAKALREAGGAFLRAVLRERKRLGRLKLPVGRELETFRAALAAGEEKT